MFQIVGSKAAWVWRTLTWSYSTLKGSCCCFVVTSATHEPVVLMFFLVFYFFFFQVLIFKVWYICCCKESIRCCCNNCWFDHWNIGSHCFALPCHQQLEVDIAWWAMTNYFWVFYSTKVAFIQHFLLYQKLKVVDSPCNNIAPPLFDIEVLALHAPG